MKIARCFVLTLVVSAAASCATTTRVRVIPVDSMGAKTKSSAHVQLDGVLVGAAPLELEVERGEREFALVDDSRRPTCNKVKVGGKRMHVRVPAPSAKASAAEQEATGSLEPAGIDRRIKERLEDLKYCYDRELSMKPRLAGKLVIHFAIAVDGTVEYAFAKYSTMADENVEECVAYVFRTFTFDPPNNNGRVKVNYPLYFSSSASP